MARTLTNEEISRLPVADRLELIATLWDSLSPTDVPLPESHRRALDGALEDYAQDPEPGRSWAEVRDELLRKR